MLVRALVVWFVILGAAFVNGAFRVAVIIPALGEYAGHVISCFMDSSDVVASLECAMRALASVAPAP